MKNQNKEFAIETFKLSKSFGNHKAVDRLTLKIYKGEIFSLLGTNGAGKTTTIKMLSCLLKPTYGTAKIMGYDINDHPQKIKEIIGVSPQETSIASRISSRENLLLMGGVFGLKKADSKKRASELLDLMELSERKNDQARKLSGGMQRRLSIAMALMSDPQILFLDEPTLGLDPHARRSVRNYIEKLKGDKTILLTTHYLEEADSLADHIAIMDKSKIIESGTSHELKQKYNSEKVLSVSGQNFSDKLINELLALNIKVTRKKEEIELKAKEIDIYSIMDIFKSNDIQIESLQMQEPTLDDVFLQLTDKEVVL